MRANTECAAPVQTGLLALTSVTVSVPVLHELAHAGLVCVTCFERTPLLRLIGTGLPWVSLIILDTELASPPSELIPSLRRQVSCPVLLLCRRAAAAETSEYGADAVLSGDRPLGPQLSPWLRSGTRPGDVVNCGAMRLDRRARLAYWHGEPLRLTDQQFRLLWRLAGAAGGVVSLAELSDAVYEGHVGNDRQRMMAHVRRIRRMIESDPRHPLTLQAVRGIGYRLAS